MEFKFFNNILSPSQWYREAYRKKYIFLHHTVGGSAQGAVDWWNTKPDHVATPFLIERNGDVYQAFEPKFWAYALGLKGGTAIEKASIHIELVAYGPLLKFPDEEQYFFVTGKTRKEIPKEEVVTFKNFYREEYHYHKYTKEQIESLRELLLYLTEEFNIPIQPDITNFWFFDREKVTNLPPGIWSHSTIRADKSDIMPQKELIEMIYGLKKANLPENRNNNTNTSNTG